MDDALLRRQLAGEIVGLPAPAVAFLKLRDAAANEFIDLVNDGDQYSLSEFGGCVFIGIGLNTAAESVRYDWTPDGGSTVVGALYENSDPFCWGVEEGWAFEFEIPDCTCRAEMTEVGTHTLTLTPCSVDVDFVGGETCAGNGGIEGLPAEVTFTLTP